MALGIQAGYYSDHTINCCYSLNSVNRIIKVTSTINEDGDAHNHTFEFSGQISL